MRVEGIEKLMEEVLEGSVAGKTVDIRAVHGRVREKVYLN